jgi:hypothetical protein
MSWGLPEPAINITTPRFAAQANRKAYDIGWRPLQFLPSVSEADLTFAVGAPWVTKYVRR